MGSPRQFVLVLLKPSHYDDDGYVIQFLRSAIPSNTLACLNGLALDCNRRRVLGDDVEIVVEAYDEANTLLPLKRITKQLRGRRGMVGLVGVQSNQFPRAMDIARPLREAGIPVAIGGFHVSGCLAMLPAIPRELQEAMDLGISLFAGEAEGRLDDVLRDAWHGRLKPLYNYMADLPALENAPAPFLQEARVRRTAGRMTSFDAGRGCPFLCSFCTIINVQGRKSRSRSADDVERIVRQNLAQGINRFFITDDNFARNREWEPIFDRLIAMREAERLNIKFVIQVDTMCHRLPRFIEKARRAGIRRVFIGLESIHPESLLGSRKKQNKIAEYRKMLLEWKRAGVTIFAGYIVGFPEDTPESVRRDIAVIQRELPIDLLEPHCLTPLPGSEDHLKLYRSGAWLDPDLNKYDLEHVTTTHARMSTPEWEKIYRDSWLCYFSREHMETIMRRAAATPGMSAGNMLFLLMWFYGCIVLEKVDPLQGGYLRLKSRTSRRPTFPRENPLVFYPKYVGEQIWKSLRLARETAHLYRLRRRLRTDPAARQYMDQALTPVTEADGETQDLFSVIG
jgi:radical SAM superfamily enzyme YgiQ (UPF0313 family)